MKFKVNIHEFGAKFYSNNTEYKLDYYYQFGYYYYFYKKGTNIYHNEYGPAIECKDGSFRYFIHNVYHRLNGCAFYNKKANIKVYYVFNKYLGETKEDFIMSLANCLIPKKEIYYQL